jgi:hypothetical protein
MGRLSGVSVSVAWWCVQGTLACINIIMLHVGLWFCASGVSVVGVSALRTAEVQVDLVRACGLRSGAALLATFCQLARLRRKRRVVWRDLASMGESVCPGLKQAPPCTVRRAARNSGAAAAAAAAAACACGYPLPAAGVHASMRETLAVWRRESAVCGS